MTGVVLRIESEGSESFRVIPAGTGRTEESREAHTQNEDNEVTRLSRQGRLALVS